MRVALGGFIDRTGRHRVARLCLGLYAVVVTGMAGLGQVGLVPLGALFGVAHGLLFPAFNAIAVAGAGVHERGKVMAIFIGSFNLGFAVGPLALGFFCFLVPFFFCFLGWAAFRLRWKPSTTKGAPQPRHTIAAASMFRSLLPRQSPS